MKYAAPKFRKRHEHDRLSRIYQEPRHFKQKQRMQSAAWQNYFFSQVETNDILNEINRMNGHIGNMIRPVQDAYFTQKRDDMMKEFDRRPRPPPMMY